MIELFIPGEPIAMPRPRLLVSKGGRVRALSNDPRHPVAAYKQQVALLVRQACRGVPLLGPVWLAVLFLMPRPKRLVWKRKPMPREWHTGVPDCDNLLKAFLDGATAGGLWLSDAQVVYIEAAKRIAAGGEPTGVHVRAVEADQ